MLYLSVCEEAGRAFVTVVSLLQLVHHRCAQGACLITLNHFQPLDCYRGPLVKRMPDCAAWSGRAILSAPCFIYRAVAQSWCSAIRLGLVEMKLL